MGRGAADSDPGPTSDHRHELYRCPLPTSGTATPAAVLVVLGLRLRDLDLEVGGHRELDLGGRQGPEVGQGPFEGPDPEAGPLIPGVAAREGGEVRQFDGRGAVPVSSASASAVPRAWSSSFIASLVARIWAFAPSSTIRAATVGSAPFAIAQAAPTAVE